MLYVPDEEIGGDDGMGQFVRSKEFGNMNVGAFFDEGFPSDDDSFLLMYGERQPWWLTIHCAGKPAHGATLPAITSSSILADILSKIQAFRQRQYELLESGEKKLGEIIGVNIVALAAGTPNGKG